MSGATAENSGLLDNLQTLVHDQDLQGAQRLLSVINIEALLRGILELEDVSAWQYMCFNSYIHANGFARITLPFLQGTQSRLRIHVWPRETADVERDAHNHRWCFASRIIGGQVTNDVYEVTDDAGEYTHFIHSSSDDKSYSLLESGRASLGIASSDVHGAGDVYSMPPTEIHDISTIPGRGAASLFLEFPSARSQTDIYTTRAKFAQGAINPTRFSPNEIRSLISDLLKGKVP